MKHSQKTSKRETAERKVKALIRSNSRYAWSVDQIKKRGLTYCEIMDYLASQGIL